MRYLRSGMSRVDSAIWGMATLWVRAECRATKKRVREGDAGTAPMSRYGNSGTGSACEIRQHSGMMNGGM
jgi:hypothetical protein